MPPTHRRKVVLVERVLTHYRVKVYEAIRAKLGEAGVDFNLVYGQPAASEAKKKDTADAPWALRIANIYLPGGLVYQPCWKHIADCDLIILEQANKLLLNFLLFAARPFKRFKLAFNGHGYCHQLDPRGLSNKLKRTYTNWPDWWFPYTEGIADFLAGNGFPRERIAVMNNSIDTREITEIASSIPADTIRNRRDSLGIGMGPVGVYCGGMYKEKEIGFLLECCGRIKRAIPGFHMILIGDGPDARLAIEAARSHPWIHYLGPKFGREKIEYLMAADAFLIPGAVGLAILDCFAVGLPLLTTRVTTHGPEIDYLENGVNGLITDFDADAYSGRVIALLDDGAVLARLKAGSAGSRAKYSMERMAENFCDGVMRCLESR